jgi:PAS domain S-box-containing protein
VIHSDDIQKSKDRWSVAQTVCEPYEAQARFRRLDGSYHWHQIKMRPIKDAHGQVSQWVGCAFDIHQIRMVEEEHEKLLQLVTSQNSLNERHLKRG